jgi:hypothetical protein
MIRVETKNGDRTVHISSDWIELSTDLEYATKTIIPYITGLTKCSTETVFAAIMGRVLSYLGENQTHAQLDMDKLTRELKMSKNAEDHKKK